MFLAAIVVTFAFAAPRIYAQEAEAQDNAAAAEASDAEGADWSGLDAGFAVLGVEGDRVLVAAPRDNLPEDAQAALNQALVSAGATLVMDDTALGDIADSSDSEIVEKAANQPADTVVIVRAFPPAPTLAITAWNIDGTAVGNFTIMRGQTAPPTVQKKLDTAPSGLAIADEGRRDPEPEPRIAPDNEPNSDEPAKEGESTTTDSISGADAPGDDATGPSGSDLERYEQQKWTLESFDDSGLVLRRKESGETIEGPEALELLGQTELADDMRDNLALKRGLYWTGAGVAGVGLVSLLIGFFSIPAAFDADAEIPTGSIVAVVGGFGGIFVGIVTAVVGWNIDAVDATRKEVRGWVDELNRPLREDLGVPPHLSRAPTAPTAIQFSWRF